MTKNKIYITGQYALNIHPENCKTTGDWHGGIWDNISIYPSEHIKTAGSITGLNTNDIWGDYGIYDGKEELQNIGLKIEYNPVYIADHNRAILDMLYDYVVNVGIIFEIDNASNEFLGDRENINEMLKMSKLIEKYLNEKQLYIYNMWYDNEMRNTEKYYGFG